MQRENNFMIFLKGAGFMLFGNILGGIMTISIAAFLDQWYIPYIAVLFTVFIYGSLIFTAGWKDGGKEAKMLRNHRVESIPKFRWIIIGLILTAIMAVPNLILLFCSLGAYDLTGEFLFAMRFICGAFAPALYIAELQSVPAMDYPAAYPIIIIALYLVVTPTAAHIGYRFGINEKNFKDYMYEK